MIFSYKDIKNKNHVFIKSTPELKEIMHHYSNTPMVINRRYLKDFRIHTKAILQKALANIEDPVVLPWLTSIYHISFHKLLTNNSNRLLVHSLILFALNLSLPFNYNLKYSVKRNLAYRNAYNVISSYKFFLRGLLTNADIFQHFERFFIYKHCSSIGRLYSDSFFLQLQANHLAKSFILFAPQKSLQEADLPKSYYNQFLLTLFSYSFSNLPKTTVAFPSKVYHFSINTYGCSRTISC